MNLARRNNSVGLDFSKVITIAVMAILMLALWTVLVRNHALAATSKAQYTIGMNFLWGNGDAKGLEERFKKMKELGITEARTDWEWRYVEQKKGVYDWTTIDKMMTLANTYGINILPIVHYAPEWALPAKKKPGNIYEMALTSDSYEAYAKFLAASIDRYGPGGNAKIKFTPIKYWQPWNEVNIKEFWGPAPNAKDFVKFMQTVNSVVGSRRGKIKIVHAGLSKADFTFLWQLWEIDPNYGRLFDIMALHPYFFNPKGGVRAVDEMDSDQAEYAALGVVGSPNDAGFLGKVFNVQLFLTLKKAPKPIWITEIGFMAGSKNDWAISEDEEKRLADSTLSYISNKLTKKAFGKGARGDVAANVERVYWFALEDYGFPDDTGNFGVYRSDGTARPLADVIKSYAK